MSLMFLLVTILSQPLFHNPDEYLVILNPFATYFTNRRCKNVKNLFVSLVNLVISYDCTGYVSISQPHTLQGIPYVSAIDTSGDQETIITLALHLILIMIEYKPPSIDNLRYLI